ncbi:MAG: WD40 repeat domain-containing protein [Capsulimonadaceae bacterium]
MLRLEGHGSGIEGVAVSGKAILSVSFDRSVRAWDAATGSALPVLGSHAARPRCVSVARDSTLAASAGDDGKIMLWDLAGAYSYLTLDTAQPGTVGTAPISSAPVTSLAIHAGVKYLLSGSMTGDVHVWNLRRKCVIRTLSGHTGRINSCTFSPDSLRVASASADGSVIVWDVNTGERIHTLYGHTWSAIGAQFLPAGNRLVSWGWDGTLRLWNLDTGASERCTVFDTEADPTADVQPPARCLAAAITADGRMAATALDDLTVRVYEIEADRALRTLVGHSEPITALAYLPDGRLVSAGRDGVGIVWDALRQPRNREGRPHSSAVCGIAALPGRPGALSAGRGGALRKWSVALDGARISPWSSGPETAPSDPDAPMSGPPDPVSTIRAWDAGGGATRIAYGTTAGEIILADYPDPAADTISGTAVHFDQPVRMARFAAHAGAVLALDVSRNGRYLLSGGIDCAARLWDLASGTLLRLYPHEGPVTSVCLMPDGPQMLSMAGSGSLHCWELATGEDNSSSLHGVRRGKIAVTPDGQRTVCCATLDTGSGSTYALIIVDNSTGEPVDTIADAHTAAITALCLTPSGTLALTGSADRTAALWDIGGRSRLAAWEFPDPVSACCAISESVYLIGDARGEVHGVVHGEGGAA